MCMYLSSVVALCLLFYSKRVTIDEADTNCHTCIDLSKMSNFIDVAALKMAWLHTCKSPSRVFWSSKNNKVIVWDNYLQLLVYDKAPGVQYSWCNVLLSAGPRFLKERKVLNHLWLHSLESQVIVEFTNHLPWVSRLYLQTFLASHIGCKTTIFLSLHQWHTDHRLSWGWGEGNVGNQRIPLGLIYAALFDDFKHLRPNVHTDFLFQMESLLLIPPLKAWRLKHYLWGVL